MKIPALLISVLVNSICIGQAFDTTQYKISFDTSASADHFFKQNNIWRGADGASSIKLGNGKVIWLFGDTFIGTDSTASRRKSAIVRNSIAVQDGYDLKTGRPQFYWNQAGKEPGAFFQAPGKFWYWPGHGVMIKDRLLIFLLKEQVVTGGLGFETAGWDAVLITNPKDDPAKWRMEYIKGHETFGTAAGSAAVLNDKNYVYAYGAVEPGTHEVYLLRWKTGEAYAGNLSRPEWWTGGKWSERKTREPVPKPLFTGATEYSVHYDSTIKKYVQVQSFGFGESKTGVRLSDSLQGPWSEPYLFHTPDYSGIKKPFMYSAKAHPELREGDGIYVTYNINSFDFEELLNNENIYYPRFILIKIDRKD